MENQHKKISGCRDLSQQEIDAMNQTKEMAEVAMINEKPQYCPHAGPHVYCHTCKADPCPLGLSTKQQGCDL